MKELLPESVTCNYLFSSDTMNHKYHRHVLSDGLVVFGNTKIFTIKYKDKTK